MNADEYSLDVSDPQILLVFPDDANGVTHHHRILLHKLGPGRWIGVTPDHDLETLALTNRAHVVLGRRARFPEPVMDVIYSFDPISRAELEALKRRARTMGVVLGDGEQVELDALVWVYADPGSEKLGTVVDNAIVSQATCLGDRGLVEVDGGIEAIMEIPQGSVSTFKESQKASLADLRTIGHHEDSQKRRYISLVDALPLMRQSSFPVWSFSGPRSVLEFLKSVQEGTSDLSTYHLQWVRHSGINQHSSVVYEHRNLLEVLRLAISRDQLDVSNLQAIELVVRRIVQLEVATARSPHSPEFSGLDVLIEAPVTAQGSAATRGLDAWVTERLKERANIQKQARLYREENSHNAKDKGAAVTDGEPGFWRKKKAKAKAKAGGGNATAGAA